MPIKTPYIYDYLFSPLWKSISKALLLCLRYKEANQEEKLSERNENLISCFDEILKVKPKPDSHIIEGLPNRHRERENIYPRVLKLTINSFVDSQKINAKGAYLIPSPLHIIYHLFIVPEHSYTAAYSITTCRCFLYQLLRLHPSHPHINEDNLSGLADRIFTETQIMDALADFDKFEKINNRWPKEIIGGFNHFDKLKTPEIQSFLGHFLATKGIAHLWFKSINAAKKFLEFKNDSSFFEELRPKFNDVRFRMASKYRELPDWGEIINQIFGFPIPIKGADVVFYGGLKPSMNGGLIISVAGRAGVGKTSLALTLADAFSPFGTQCFYISLEEEIKDIRRRLQTLRPQIEKELSFFDSKPTWFNGLKYPHTASLDLFTEEILELSSVLNKDIKDSVADESRINLPSVCPHIIVIDNITELFAEINKDDYVQIEKFIDVCRSLNSIVLLLSPEAIIEDLKIDYLVDVAIELKHKDNDKDDAKPTRIFNLLKTRQQLSRQGSHIFHLSGPEGFRISPQIPSQIDRKEKFHRNLYDESKIIHTLNFLNDHSKQIKIPTIEFRNLKYKIYSKANVFLELFPRTHMLVHGFGSAGKAGFALKLLLTPPVKIRSSTAEILTMDFSHVKYRRNILIISFLYPRKYYEGLISEKKNLQSKIRNTFKNITDPIIEYLVLYPGYLTPQDFLNKVTRKLDEASLRGQPFTGVLVDGLHNVFLQFENLQNNNMVWPMLYNILSRYELTVVSTFTNFSLNDKLIDDNSFNRNQMINQAIPDYILLQKGMAPFLHALVKASDYYFFMEQLTSNIGKKRYLLGVKGSISNVPDEFLEWNRDLNVFENIYTVSDIKAWLNEGKVIKN